MNWPKQPWKAQRILFNYVTTQPRISAMFSVYFWSSNCRGKSCIHPPNVFLLTKRLNQFYWWRRQTNYRQRQESSLANLPLGVYIRRDPHQNERQPGGPSSHCESSRWRLHLWKTWRWNPKWLSRHCPSSGDSEESPGPPRTHRLGSPGSQCQL